MTEDAPSFEDLPPTFAELAKKESLQPPPPMPESPLQKLTYEERAQLTKSERAEIAGMMQALQRDVQGWNVRCNVCGDFGAIWRDDPEVQAAVGHFAACRECYGKVRKEIERHRQETDRHRAAMQQITLVSFPVQPSVKSQELAFRRIVDARSF